MVFALLLLLQINFANEVETDHFRLRSDIEKEQLTRYGRFLEAALKELQRLYMPLEKFAKVEVWIFSSRKKMQQELGLHKTSGGVYIHSKRCIVTYHGVFSQTGDTYQTLAHELTHAYQHALLGSEKRLPPWLLEGMAACSEGIRPTKTGARFKRPLYARLTLVRVETDKKQEMPLEELLKSQTLTSRHYAYAATFLYFLLKKPSCRAALLSCLETAKKAPLKTGTFLKTLYEETKWDKERLQREFRRFIKALRIPHTGVAVGKTYKSRMLGFKTRAPGKKWRISIEKLLEGPEAVVYWRQNPWARFSVTAYPNSYALTTEQAAQERLSKLKNASKSSVKVAGKDAVCIEFTSQRRIGAVVVLEVWLATERFVYRLKFECKPEHKQRLKREFEKALKAFSLYK